MPKYREKLVTKIIKEMNNDFILGNIADLERLIGKLLEIKDARKAIEKYLQTD